MDTIQYYPTPEAVIALMVAPYKKEGTVSYGFNKYKQTILSLKDPILEPSAGKGNIIEYLKENFNIERNFDFFAIEIDLNRRMILQEKNITVIGSDFLSYSSVEKFGTILMNPPFLYADAHILKAWEILKPDGFLVSLCSAEIIKHPNTKKEKLLASIIKEYGQIEYIGQAFQKSERSTDVEIAIVRLTKPNVSDVDNPFNDANVSVAEINLPGLEINPLAKRNDIENLVKRFHLLVERLKEKALLQKEINFLMTGISRKYEKKIVTETCSEETNFIKDVKLLREVFWESIFTATKLGERCPSTFVHKFTEFYRNQKNMEFNIENIYEVLDIFFNTKDEAMEESMLKVFSDITKYYENTTVWIEGWKTNKPDFLPPKIIIPSGLEWNGDRFNTYTSNVLFDDLDKVLCWLSGTNYENIKTIRSAMREWAASKAVIGAYYSSWFKINSFKKGTTHLTFLDLEVLKYFNWRVGQLKQWIGPEVSNPYKKKQTTESKDLVTTS